MNSRTSRFLILLGVLSLALLTPEFLAQEAEVVENTAKASRFVGTLWAILPPIIAIGLALITKEVYTSLFIGIFFGCLLITNFKPIESIDVVIQTGIIPAVQVGAGIFIFLVTLGVIAALLSRTGSADAFGKWARQHVKTRCGAQLATFFLGVLIFIDDYFNCLTVGNVMRPVTDAHRISRAKLAYIIDATAAPVCMIAPISSWAAAVSNFTKGTEYNGIQLFIHAIPFNFYSLLTFVFILAIVLLKLDYGPMAIHEKNAFEKGDLFTSGGEVGDDMNPIENSKGKFIDLVLPVVVLVITCVWGLMRAGGYGTSTHRIMDAFANTDASLGLSAGGLVALIFTIAYLLLRRVISAKEAFKCIPSGFIAMVPAILILTWRLPSRRSPPPSGWPTTSPTPCRATQGIWAHSCPQSSSWLHASSHSRPAPHGAPSASSSRLSATSSQAQTRSSSSESPPALPAQSSATTAPSSATPPSCPRREPAASTSTTSRRSFRMRLRSRQSPSSDSCWLVSSRSGASSSRSQSSCS